MTSADFDDSNVHPDAGSPGSVPDYAVKLPVFEGPLDLLLHLIRQNEVEITEIPIAQVARQYLEYLGIMRELDLDVVGEYLVMAATLAHIKSRMLLPPLEGEEDEEEFDPRADLVQRLLEYQRYKEVAEALGERRLLGRDVFGAQGTAPEAIPEGEREIEVGLFELIEAFRLMLRNAPSGDGVHRVESETVTVRDQMLMVMAALAQQRSIEFIQVFQLVDGQSPSRTVLVATFLAILELARLDALHLYQGVAASGTPEGSIRLRANVSEDSLDWQSRVTDLM